MDEGVKGEVGVGVFMRGVLHGTGERRNNADTVTQETVCIVVFSCMKSDVLNSTSRGAEGAAVLHAEEPASKGGTAGVDRRERPPGYSFLRKLLEFRSVVSGRAEIGPDLETSDPNS